MDEAEWLACTDPMPMLRFIGHQATDRKLRLFACACCRRAWHLIPEADRAAVEISEQLADRMLSEEEFTRVTPFIPQYHLRGSRPDRDSAVGCAAWAAWYAAAAPGDAGEHAGYTAQGTSEGLAREAGSPHDQQLIRESEWATQAGMLRCIFGPIPFRLVFADPRWRTAAVMGLVRTIYNDRELDLLPILADALEDAGCDSEEDCQICVGGVRMSSWEVCQCETCGGAGRFPNPLLAHLRGPGPHVRGCWVVDLLLGKE